MIARTAESSPRFTARMAGLFFLLTMLTGVFAEMFVSGSLVVYGDAAATATNILAHKGLFQLGYAVYLVEMACNLVTTVLFYVLLKPVNGTVALLAAFFGLTGCVIKTVSRLFFIAPLFILGGAHSLGAFSTGQLQALALLFLKVNNAGAGMALVFLGLHGVAIGYLIFKSTFLPRVFGVLGMLGGLGWVTFLYPPLAYRLWSVLLLFGLGGALGQILWLLVVGVNEPRWKDTRSSG